MSRTVQIFRWSLKFLASFLGLPAVLFYMYDPLSENPAHPAFMKIEIRPEINISMFNCAAVKKWKRSIARFPSYGAKHITDAERKFSRKCNVFTLLQ